jgi:hypothetical protein
MKIKLRDSLEPIRKKRIKIIKKGINYLPTKHAIGNIKANATSRQKRFLKIGFLRLKSACRNKLISIRLMGTNPWSSLILRN